MEITRIDHDPAKDVMYGVRAGRHDGRAYLRFDFGKVSYRITKKENKK